MKVATGESCDGGAVTEKVVGNIGPTEQEGEGVDGMEAGKEHSTQLGHNDKLCTPLSAHRRGF